MPGRQFLRDKTPGRIEGPFFILVNRHGELTETTIANLAVRLDGTWWTPPTSSGCLPGVERGRLLVFSGVMW